MAGWLTAFRAIPWAELIAAAPVVVQGAQKLWATVKRKDAPPAATSRPEDRQRALDAQIEELRNELAATSELIAQLAEQNRRLIEAVDALRIRTRVLLVACAVLGAGVLLVLLSGSAAAQSYPQRPVRLVVGLPPGGSTDVMARIVAAKLGERLGQQVVVDNRPGASGTIGIQLVVNSQPDGHTLIMAAGSWGTIMSLYKLPFDLRKDLAPVAFIGTSPYVLVVQPSLPVRSVTELIAHAKANPGKLTFAGSTPGSLQRLAGELLKRTGGFDMLYVPYKGTGAVMPDLLGGRLDVAFDNVLILTPYIKKGQLRALGVTSSKRSVVFPELPTLAETGVPGFHAVGWFGIFTAAKTPQPVIKRLNSEIVGLLKEAETRDRLLAQGAEPQPGSPDDLRRHLAGEIEKWGKVIRDAGIKAE
jgi:tripartite-type tricarboxylate transporter receptor subunit TctC